MPPKANKTPNRREGIRLSALLHPTHASMYIMVILFITLNLGNNGINFFNGPNFKKGKEKGLGQNFSSKVVKCKLRILLHTFSKNIKAYMLHIKYSTGLGVALC